MTGLFLVIGSCCRGRKKTKFYSQKIKNNVIYDLTDRQKLMQFHFENDLSKPTYENGVINFSNGKQTEIYKFLNS